MAWIGVFAGLILAPGSYVYHPWPNPSRTNSKVQRLCPPWFFFFFQMTPILHSRTHHKLMYNFPSMLKHGLGLKKHQARHSACAYLIYNTSVHHNIQRATLKQKWAKNLNAGDINYQQANWYYSSLIVQFNQSNAALCCRWWMYISWNTPKLRPMCIRPSGSIGTS